MFRARVLRPLVWALPLLVVGWAAATVLVFVPAHNGRLSCGSIMFPKDQYVIYGEPVVPGGEDVHPAAVGQAGPLPVPRTCNAVLADRLTYVVLIAGLSTLPALVAGVRAVCGRSARWSGWNVRLVRTATAGRRPEARDRATNLVRFPSQEWPCG